MAAPATTEEGFIDVSEAHDGGVMKKVLKEGDGTRAAAGDEIKVGPCHTRGSVARASQWGWVGLMSDICA
jgi:hypothetical protein